VTFELTKKVDAQLEDWLENDFLRRFPSSRNAWIYAKEGKIFIRFCRGLHRIDLASFEIDEDWWCRGVSRSIIKMACQKPMPIVRIENVANPGWAKKLVEFRVDGRKTIVTRDCIGTPTVDFVQEAFNG
jgi:hypothetical protein